MFLHSKQRSKPAAGQEVRREGVHVPGREWEQKCCLLLPQPRL